MKDKHVPDRSGELYQDAFTENESKPRGQVRDDVEGTMHLDPDVDSQEADRALAENRFGLNERNTTNDSERPKDTELERRSGPDAIREINPYPARERAEITYGETDTDPRREDQPDEHHAAEDEHL